MLKDMLEPGGLLFLTLPLSCLTPQPAHELHGRGSGGKGKGKGKDKTRRGAATVVAGDSGSSSSSSSSSSSNAAARAAPGFDRSAFEALLTAPTPLGFALLPAPDSKTSEKVVFYCLQRRGPAAVAAGAGGAAAGGSSMGGSTRKAPTAVAKPAMARGFSVVFPRFPRKS